MNAQWSGVWTALVTPFRNGEVDLKSLESLVERQLQSGMLSGFVLGGTTGESPTLTEKELKQIYQTVKAVAQNRVRLIVGTGSNSTAKAIASTQLAKEMGADGALVVVPYYNKPSQDGLFEHFKAIATQSQFPILLYNVPSRTITRLEFETIQRLSEVPYIEAIKEASGDIDLGQKIATSTPLCVLSGDDATCLKLKSVGGQGVISVISHLFPETLGRAFKSSSGLTSVEAAKIDSLMAELNRLLYVEANPIPLKFALAHLGWIASDELRLPLTSLNPRHRAALIAALESAGLTKQGDA